MEILGLLKLSIDGATRKRVYNSLRGTNNKVIYSANRVWLNVSILILGYNWTRY